MKFRVLIAAAFASIAGITVAAPSHSATAEGLIAVAYARVEGGERGAMQLLALEDRPTALFMMDGTMAIGALQGIAKLGLRCPEDIALASFDDFTWAAVMRPRLTVIDQPTYEIGQQSAYLLFERLQNQKKAPREIRLQTRLIVRESCGAMLQ